MASYIGLDLSTRQARILEAEGSAKKLKIKNFVTVDLPPPEAGPASAFMSKEAADLVAKAFSQNKIGREPICMSWDSDHTVFRELDLPFTNDEQIRKVIKYEAESHLLNCDIDDVIVCFYKLAENKEREKSRVLVMAAQKEHLLNRFEMLARGGIDPIQVDLDVMASFNALSGTGIAKDHQNFLVLDCGRRTTNLLLVAGGRLVSGRAIRLGSDSVMRRLAGDLGASPEELGGSTTRLLEDPNEERRDDLLVPAHVVEGEDKPETEKTPEELRHDLALQEAETFYRRLGKEVRRSLVMSNLPESIEAIYLTGPGSLLPGFEDKVAKQIPFEAPIERLRLLDRVEHDFDGEERDEVEAEMLTALGLAYKAAGHDDTGVDFRQEECRYARRFDQIKETLVYFCALLFFLVLLVNLYDIRKLSVRKPFLWQQQHADITRIYDAAKEKYIRALGAKNAKIPEKYEKASIASLGFIDRQLTSRIETLEAELGRGGAIPAQMSAFKAWKDTFDSIAADMDKIGKLWLSEINISVGNQRRPYIEISGYVRNATAFSDLMDSLRKIPGIDPTSIEPGSFNDGGDRGYQFTRTKAYYPEQEL